MSRPLRQLLPAASDTSNSLKVVDDTSKGLRGPSPLPKTHTACLQCRKSKAKCSGHRPVCNRCAHSSFPCEYSARVGETLHEALKRQVDELEVENEQLKTLLRKLGTKTEAEALEILRRLRLPDADLQSICQLLEDGNVMLQGQTMIHARIALAAAETQARVQESAK